MTGVEARLLPTSDRSRKISDARAMFIHAATDLLKKPNEQIARHLGVSSSAISAARRRGRGLAERYEFQKALKGRV
jgi:IS30 family transposase